MPTPILATKLYLPPPRPEAISRCRLIEQLQGGLRRKLTLISAPAGFGKTTLVSQWVSNCARAVTWLSLDEEDNDLQRLLSYLIAALQTISANMGESILAALQSPQPPETKSILTRLINEITALPDPFILVLDDYHLIDTTAIDSALTFLLEHLPPQAHLALATREDPALPLARLRVQGQLSELRVKDLRFTTSEAAEFLNQRMGLNLSEDDIVALESRTEGWIAGLQLAALSMQGRSDTARFIQAFTGSHHFILDYLVEEVLQRQPALLRRFLLQTSILQRLSGPLCDAVTQQADGSGQLETLERGNLFVVTLDDQRQWYRYHHLFAEVLQTHLLKEQPEQFPTLHWRASQWYEHHDLPADAIYHALAAEDFERAADLVELNWRLMNRRYQYATVVGWMQSLPEELVRVRPVLSAGYAWALMCSGELEAAEPHLQTIERWLNRSNHPDAESTEMVVVNEAEFQSLPATLAAARAYQAQTFGDLPSAIKHAQQALALLPEEYYSERAVPASLLGLSYWANGDLEAAHRSFSEVVTSFKRAGNVLNTIDLSYLLADIRATQGRLRSAFGSYQQAVEIATGYNRAVLRGTADLHLGISELYREWNDLDTAEQQLQISQALDEQATLPGWPHRSGIAQARLKEAQGDLAGALDLLDTAERVYYRSPLPDLRPLAALKARVWLKQGRVNEALNWVQQQGLSVNDNISYLREFEHLTLARVLIAQYRRDKQNGPSSRSSIDGCSTLLKRLLSEAKASGRLASTIEILVLQALMYEVQDNIPAALVPLKQALTLAEPEGYVRLFVNEGTPMAALLREATKYSSTLDYVNQLQSVFGQTEGKKPVAQKLTEPLSERELEVLRLLRTELTGPEIASSLMVSLNTMRTHTKNIYNKLGVNNRRAAVRYAEELDLL